MQTKTVGALDLGSVTTRPQIVYGQNLRVGSCLVRMQIDVLHIFLSRYWKNRTLLQIKEPDRAHAPPRGCTTQCV